MRERERKVEGRRGQKRRDELTCYRNNVNKTGNQIIVPYNQELSYFDVYHGSPVTPQVTICFIFKIILIQFLYWIFVNVFVNLFYFLGQWEHSHTQF